VEKRLAGSKAALRIALAAVQMSRL